MREKNTYVAPFIRRVMKDASEEDIVEASNQLRDYLRILWGVFLRQNEQHDSPNLRRRDRFSDMGR